MSEKLAIFEREIQIQSDVVSRTKWERHETPPDPRKNTYVALYEERTPDLDPPGLIKQTVFPKEIVAKKQNFQLFRVAQALEHLQNLLNLHSCSPNMPPVLSSHIVKSFIQLMTGYWAKRNAIVSFILCCSSTRSTAEQFSHWYGFYTVTILDVAGPKCYPNYTAGGFPEYARYTKGGPLDTCKGMATCLLQNIDEFDRADMQSATIILGLMPTILSYFGPTVGEMALISSRRPVLAMLLTLGAPAIFATRPFEFDNPQKRLKKKTGTFVFHRQSPVKATATVAVQYFGLSLAVTNCLLNSMQLGTSTILVWKCRWSYLQLGWNFMPLVPHFCAALSTQCSKVSHYVS